MACPSRSTSTLFTGARSSSAIKGSNRRASPQSGCRPSRTASARASASISALISPAGGSSPISATSMGTSPSPGSVMRAQMSGSKRRCRRGASCGRARCSSAPRPCSGLPSTKRMAHSRSSSASASSGRRVRRMAMASRVAGAAAATPSSKLGASQMVRRSSARWRRWARASAAITSMPSRVCACSSMSSTRVIRSSHASNGVTTRSRASPSPIKGRMGCRAFTASSGACAVAAIRRVARSAAAPAGWPRWFCR
ncbi:hypothetical protein D3C71_1050620 [compost metagenome]